MLDIRTYSIKLTDLRSKMECLGPYVDYDTLTPHRCKERGHEFKATPKNIVVGMLCPECKVIERRNSYLRRLKLEREGTIECLGNYTTMYVPIKHKCTHCNHTWDMKPAFILQGLKCPKCFPTKRWGGGLGHDQYLVRLSKIRPDLECLGKYVLGDVHLLHRCKICTKEFTFKPKRIRVVKCPNKHETDKL